MIPIAITKINQSRFSEFDPNNIIFGKIYSDHMFVCDFKNGEWTDARIEPYSEFALSPATSALHYGQSIFEGLKAFCNEQNQVALFRPMDNAKRLNRSASRMVMPHLPEEIFMQGLISLLQIDEKWVPSMPGSSLYIRPYMFATDAYVGVKPSETFRFCIITSPVGPYYSKPLAVKVEQEYCRAVKGGTGNAKCAGNYAAAMLPTLKAMEQGYDQILWTDGIEHKYIEETGTTNVFIVKEGEIITPALTDSLLDGITRDSVIKLANSMNYKVAEKAITVDELETGLQNKQITEIFISGTAATILNIYKVGIGSTNYELAVNEDTSIASKLKNALLAIRMGSANDDFNWRLVLNQDLKMA